MADLLARADVLELIGHRADQSVSVFLPTHRTAPGNEQDRIRLRNLLDQTEQRLMTEGLRAPEVRSLLAPALALLEPGTFWSYQSDGLALFLGPGFFRMFRLPVELPELVVVGTRFHVKPLLALLAADRRFYVLALSQSEVRLLEGTRQHVEEIELRDIPQDLHDTLRYDELVTQRLAHVAGRGHGGPLVFHGHGIGGEVDKALLERYLREVDEGLWRTVLREERAPLVLAGVEYERSMFRGITRYAHVLEAGIDGNPEQLSAEVLHERAWQIVRPAVTRARSDAAERLEQAIGRGRGVASDLEAVVQAAIRGQVDSLFAAATGERWGRVDPQTLEVEQHSERQPGDQDLLEVAAVRTVLGSGELFVVPDGEVPGGGAAAALLRY